MRGQRVLVAIRIVFFVWYVIKNHLNKLNLKSIILFINMLNNYQGDAKFKLFMKENLSKLETSNILAQEENLLDWNEVLKKLQNTFGNDVYESWIRNINLKKEYNHYVILSAPTRFVRDWIVSRYADKVLDIIKTFKKSIQRIEFYIEESEEKKEKYFSNNVFKTKIFICY